MSDTVADTVLSIEETTPPEYKELQAQLQQLEAIPGHNAAIESAKQDIKQQLDAIANKRGQEHLAEGLNREQLKAIAMTGVGGDRSTDYSSTVFG